MTEFIEALKKTLDIPDEEQPALLSPLTLAYIGDNVYETANRLLALKGGNRQTEKLHRECSARASAVFQAKAAVRFEAEGVFTEDEERIYLRGRNARVYTKAKNATVTEYHEATGLEAVIGYLFLNGEYDRLSALLAAAFSGPEKD